MSTKRLSRTVIEGGRGNFNKWDRRYSHAEERAAEKEFCKKVQLCPEMADELDIDSLRHVGKDFTDKLSPMERWLDSQVGKAWSEVRSEVFKKFDTRTTAGRHITFDHLLRSVEEAASGFNSSGYVVNPEIELEKEQPHSYYRSWAAFYVDSKGILQGSSKWKRHNYYSSKYENLVTQDFIDIADWLDGRMIIEKDGDFHWLVSTEGIWKAGWFEPNRAPDVYRTRELKYYLYEKGIHEVLNKNIYGLFKTKEYSNYWLEIENPFSFRQRGVLNENDKKYFHSLIKPIKDDILSFGKGR